MAGEILKEFLITLGYKIDPGSQNNFKSGVVAITAVVDRLHGAVAAAGEAAVNMALNVGRRLEDLYWVTQRTGASARQINAFEYAIEQLGGTAEGARSAIEAVSAAARTNPGMEALIDLITGIPEKGRGTVQTLYDLSTAFRRLKDEGRYFEAVQLAQQLGIDETTLQAMVRNLDQFAGDDTAFAKKFGVDSDDASEQGRGFMTIIRELGAEFKAFWTSASSDLLPIFDAVTGAVRLLVDLLFALEKAIAGAVRAILGDFKGSLDAWAQAGEAIKRAFDVKDLPDIAGWAAKQAKAVSEAAHEIWQGIFGPSAPPKPTQPPSQRPPGLPRPKPSTRPSGTAQRLPLGLRYNNPGNLQPGGKEAYYPTAEAGLSAMAANLMAYARRGLDWVEAIIKRWAPEFDEKGRRINDTAAYINDVAGKLGVKPGDRIDLKDPETLRALMGAMVTHENGFNPYSLGQLSQAASARLGAAGGAQAVTLNQKTEINVSGAGDPRGTAVAMEQRQGRVNGDLVRNLAGAVR